MASRIAPAEAGLGVAERFVTSAFRVLGDVLSAVGDGVRAHKDYSVRVGQGADPVEAAAVVVRSM
jgi:hypothetical protein